MTSLTHSDIRRRFETAGLYRCIGLMPKFGTAATVNMAFAGEKYLKLLLDVAGFNWKAYFKSPFRLSRDKRKNVHSYSLLFRRLNSTPLGQRFNFRIMQLMCRYRTPYEIKNFYRGLVHHQKVFEQWRYTDTEPRSYCIDGWLDRFVEAARLVLIEEYPFLAMKQKTPRSRRHKNNTKRRKLKKKWRRLLKATFESMN